jgi:hypothetical protein
MGFKFDKDYKKKKIKQQIKEKEEKKVKVIETHTFCVVN